MSLIEILSVLILTFITSFGIIKYSGKLRSEGVMSVMKSQSTIYSKVKNFIPSTKVETKIDSQARKFVSERIINIVAVDNVAYWVKNNTFFMANIVEGKIDHDTMQEVDTINMSKEDLDKMIFIMDSLKDDS